MRRPSRPRLKPWSVLRRTKIFDAGSWFTVWKDRVKLPDQRVVDPFYRITHRDYVVVFAVDQEGRVATIWHYKHGPGRTTLALPAGYVDAGETRLQAAKREFREEVGMVARQWRHLATLAVDGNRGMGSGHFFLASGLRRHGKVDPSGDLEESVIAWMNVKELTQRLERGHVATLGGMTGILLGLHTLRSRKAIGSV